MVNKQKCQLFFPTKLPAHAYLRLERKVNTTLSSQSTKTIKSNPEWFTLHLLLSVEECFLIVILTRNQFLCVYGGSIKENAKFFLLVFWSLLLLFCSYQSLQWCTGHLQLIYSYTLSPSISASVLHYRHVSDRSIRCRGAWIGHRELVDSSFEICVTWKG